MAKLSQNRLAIEAICLLLSVSGLWSGAVRAEVVQLYNGAVYGIQNSASQVGMNSGNNFSWAQSFTNAVGPVQLTSVTAYLSKADGTNPTGDFRISLFRATHAGGLATPTGAALYSTGNISVAGLGLTTLAAQKDFFFTGTGTWDLDATVSDYMLVFDGSLLTGSNYFYLQDSTTYVSGQNLAYQQNSGSWSGVAGQPPPTSAMVIYANTVPEPGALLLMFVAQVAGLMVWRFRRKRKSPGHCTV